MAVKIRLMRLGKNKQAHYRIVAIESYKKQNSDYLDQLGVYDPKIVKDNIKIDAIKLKNWISKGAQLSEGAYRLLKKHLS